MVNPKLFAAAGVALPDDRHLDAGTTSGGPRAVAEASPKGTYGAEYPTDPDSLDLYARQRGECSTPPTASSA